MRMRLLFAAGAVAGLGCWGAVLAGAQEPPQPGHQHGGAHGGERPPTPRWSGPNPTQVNTTRYIPRTTVRPVIAHPPLHDADGRPIKGLPPIPKNPHVVEEPGVGPKTGPTNPTGEPEGPTIEPSLREATVFWANYWEVHRRHVLAKVRGWKRPRHPLTGEIWDDALVQVLLRALLDRDPWVSAEAAVALGGSGKPEMMPLLARLARGEGNRPSHIVRSGAILGLGLCPEPRSGAVLQEIVAEYNPEEIQARADRRREEQAGNAPGQPIKQRGGLDIEALTKHEYRAAYALTGMAFSLTAENLDYLIQLVKRSDMPLRMRVAALTAIARQEDPSAAGFLVSVLMTPHLPHQLRGSAAVGIGRSRAAQLPGLKEGTRPATALLEVLRITGADSRSTRLGVASGLSYCGRPEDLPAMRAWLDGWKAVPHVEPEKATPGHPGEDDTTVRSAFLAAMGHVGRGAPEAERAATRDYLVSHLTLKRPPAVRGFAALALGLLQDAGAAKALLATLSEDPDTHVRGAAAVALGLLDHTPAVGPMLEQLGKMAGSIDKQADAAYVLEGLGLLRDDEARALVRKRFMEAPDQHQRRAAGLALAINGDSSIVLELVEDLTSGDQWRGPGAAFALSFYPQDEVRVVLMEAARAERPEVRVAAVKVLGSWLHDPIHPSIQEFAAAGVLFPRYGAHLYNDLLIWQ